jgi:small conductance mechanosensitive channel
MNTSRLFSPEFWQHMATILALKTWDIAKILIFFLLAKLIAYRLINRIVTAATGRQGEERDVLRLKTLCGLLKSVIFYVLTFICVIMALEVFSVPLTSILTVTGMLGLAVGFGAQKLVKDVISGFFAALENQYSVGEYITIGAMTGTVVELGMRVTKLRDDDGKLVIIPNGDVPQVINHSRGPIKAVIDLGIAPTSDMELVRAAIAQAGEEVASTIDGVTTAPKSEGIAELDATKLVIRISCEVKAGRQHAAQSAMRESIRKAFDEEGISFV